MPLKCCAFLPTNTSRASCWPETSFPSMARWCLRHGAQVRVWDSRENPPQAGALDAAATRHRAQREDPGAVMLFVLVTAAACASLVAVAMNVNATQALQGWSRALGLVLMGLSLTGAWLLIQCVFTLHYARVYYRSEVEGGEPQRGLAFPDRKDPDYLDLLYYSAVVGMTSQVSDVSIRSRAMRHLTLVHALLSFAFNLVVLATAVNVLASAGR